MLFWTNTVSSQRALDGCHDFLVRSGWLLLVRGALHMAAIISWCTLDGRGSVMNSVNMLIGQAALRRGGHILHKGGNCAPRAGRYPPRGGGATGP